MGIFSMTLDVDEDTFQRWRDAAVNLARIVTLPLQVVGPVDARLGSIPTSVSVSGKDVLMWIGQACTRPERPEDPSALYALLRYAPALSRITKGLMLDAGVATLDSHKKRVLSDEFGCGLALLISRVIAAGPLLFLDTETAIQRGYLKTRQSRSKRPDYFAVVEGDPTRTYVIEAKGTQQGNRYCREVQLIRGCQQVAGVRIVPPSATPPIRCVVGTALKLESSSSRSRVFVADPPEIAAEEYLFIRPLEEVVPAVHYLHVAQLIADDTLEARIPERTLGAPVAARPVGVRGTGATDEGSDLEWRGPMRRTQSREYVGSEVTFRGPAGEVNFFIGLRQDVRRQLVEGSVRDAARVATEHEMPADVEFPNSTWTTSGKDGTVLTCRVS